LNRSAANSRGKIIGNPDDTMDHQDNPNPAQAFNLLPAIGRLLQPEILAVDVHGNIFSASATAEQSLRIGNPKILPAIFLSLVQDCAAKNQRVSVPELHIQTGIGPANKYFVSAQPFALAENRFFLISLTDITGFSRLQQGVERLDRLATIGTLSASMAHEIKNALVAVKTFVDLLLEKNKDAELAEIVGREMSRVNNIVKQLLKFGSSTPPTRTPVRLHDVLEHSLRMVQHQLDGKLISLNRSFNAAHDAVQGDNHQLEQVFVNLFLNALDATGTNGSLTVRTEYFSAAPPELAPQRAGQPHVRITVADTGAGIAPENLDRLFEPFFTTKDNGTGLGLPITRRIIQEHDGCITVQSKQNCGTTFSIVLPSGNSPD
jgi:signal transduction histidine kinase